MQTKYLWLAFPLFLSANARADAAAVISSNPIETSQRTGTSQQFPDADMCPGVQVVECPTQKWWIVIMKDAGGHTWMGDSKSIKRPVEQFIVRYGEPEEPDRDFRTVWFHKYYPDVEKSGMKSAKLQWVVDCKKRTWRQLKYIDYDVSYNVLDSGELDQDTRPVQAGNTSEQMFEFACNSAEYRKRHYTGLGPELDYRVTAEFFNDPRELTRTTYTTTDAPEVSRPPPVKPTQSPSAAAQLSLEEQAVRDLRAKYKKCVVENAKKLASSKEEAPVVAQSAVQSCAKLENDLYFLIESERGGLSAKSYVNAIAPGILAEAQLTVVRARVSGSR